MFPELVQRPLRTFNNKSLRITGGTQAQVLASDTALVVIDPQYMFCTKRPNKLCGNPDVAVDHVERTLDRIALARDYADAQNMPTFIVYIVNGMGNDPSIPFGTGDYGLYRQRLSGHYELAVKSAESAFQKSVFYDIPPELPVLLKEYANVRNLVFAGFNTNMCVYGTMEDAIKRKYGVSLLSDCTANAPREWAGQEFRVFEKLRNMDASVVTLDEWRRERAHLQRIRLPYAAPANRPERPGSLKLAG